MDKYHDIKIGDSVYLNREIGFTNWNRTYWGIRGLVELKVSKITKTQFTTECGMRFKKERGQVIGDSFVRCVSPSESKLETFEPKALNRHKEKLSVIAKAYRLNDDRKLDLTGIKNIDDALLIAQKILELHEFFKSVTSK